MKAIFIILLCSSLTVMAQNTMPLTLKGASSSPTMLAEGSISTFLNERDFAISPDGKEIYYSVSTPKSSIQTIVSIKQVSDGTWTTPEVVSFAGVFSDIEPAFSADGNTMYFASNRPLAGDKPKDFDIWKVKRSGSGWGTPEHTGQVINTSADEFFPSLTKSGDLYFTAEYKGGPGREDIYVARWKDNAFQKPVALDTAVNSRTYEFNAFVDPDEQFILFTSYGRKDDTGGGDIYLSMKGADGRWKPAENMKSINSKQLDYCPYISPDKKLFFFTSERHALPVSFSTRTSMQTIRDFYTQSRNGSGNIYWMNWNPALNK
ncbi:MAG: PD40 domain-containing protein [Cyclobacteriaceae bacterium]|nr:PD40 domain-containing protein [Cyclobacteriaceae bacterium]